jgi:fatty acid desaturase
MCEDGGAGTVRPSEDAPIAPPRPCTDPLAPDPGPRNAVERWAVTLLRDPRDLVFLRVAAALSALVLPVAALFFSGVLPAWAGALWIPVLFGLGAGRFTLMLHAVCHRPLFKREHAWLEHYIPWVLGPFFGQTPDSFYVHHMGMHHPENNEADDLSCTLGYQRDRFAHFLHYWARFFFVGYGHLVRYLVHRKRTKLWRTFVRGELSWLAAVSVLLYVAPGPTCAVFVGPFLMIRWFMMAGNWAQHAFVDVEQPGNAWRNSTCLLNVPYNHKSYNDGYHIVHHLKPSLHWSEMARWYLDHLDEAGQQDAVVFDGLGNNQTVWWCLMTQQWDRLATHLVDLPGAPVRDHAEKVAWLQARVRRRSGVPLGLFELAAAPAPSAA